MATDIFAALDIQNTPDAIKRLDRENHTIVSIYSGNSPNPCANIVNEYGLYDIVFSSRKKEAKEFKRWVFGIIKALREASGLKAYQAFHMFDKEFQKDAMRLLSEKLVNPIRRDFIRANTIANKAVSTRFGYDKMLGKSQMSPEMLLDRQPILQDTVTLMAANDSFDLGLSISDAVYAKYASNTVQ